MQLEVLIENIDTACHIMQSEAIRSVSKNLTMRNWIIGYYIVEYEQNGKDRAKYGDALIINLAKKLSHKKGMSTTNLKLFKMFYRAYPQISQTVTDQFKLEYQKSQTVSDKSLSVPVDKLLNVCTFSHFIELVKMDNNLKRTFYEVEAIKGQMNFYVNYYKNEISGQDDNPPIGLILCANKNSTKVKYAKAGLDENLFVSKYKISLPSVEEMEAFIEEELVDFNTYLKRDEA
jgi:hypothetical protein